MKASVDLALVAMLRPSQAPIVLMLVLRLSAVMIPLGTLGQNAEIRFPVALEAGLAVSLVAAEPEIVTPIGVAVDHTNRVFVVESHTHFPPKEYPGPRNDRILVFDDTDGDGKPERRRVFFEGLTFSMNLAFHTNGALYLTHRNGVVAFPPREGASTLEIPSPAPPRAVLNLETAGNYPHNGLGGLAFSDDGWLYVAIGENEGLPYTIRGADGSSQSGAGEGGRVFRCRPDGSHVEIFATGFWNPFGLAFLNEHYLLGIDNDADSRPPCRLLDVVQGGDYGYQYRHGRSGLHPFSCWNGELPGTLPMISGTGEGPSGILTAFKKNVPSVLGPSTAWVTSWGDHQIEAFSLQPVGSSLRSEARPIIKGDDTFRPVGIGAASDGSVFVTDWVSRDYTLHGKGRLWQLTSPAKSPARARSKALSPGPPTVTAARVQLEQIQNGNPDYRSLLRSLQASDPFITAAALRRLAEPVFQQQLRDDLTNPSPRTRLGALIALRRLGDSRVRQELGALLTDPSEEVRLIAVIAAAETGDASSLPLLSRALSGGRVSPRLLEAYHAANLQLSKGSSIDARNQARTSRSSPNAARKIHLIDLDNQQGQEESAALELVTSATPLSPVATVSQAIRVLAFSRNPAATTALFKTVLNRDLPADLRGDAVVAFSGRGLDSLPRLLPLLRDDDAILRRESTHALAPLASPSTAVAASLAKSLERELAAPKALAVREQLELALVRGDLTKLPHRPASPGEWASAVELPGDPRSGMRVFHRPSASCSKCHRIEGIGGQIGPDLSTIARGSNQEKLVRSILQPSAEIAPQFTTHLVTTADGEQFSGLLAAQDADGSLVLTLADNRAAWIPAELIKERRVSGVSLMPEGLEAGMTVQDLRDLLAFLLSRR